MITKVLSADGAVNHDCHASGCEVSWDGYKIATGKSAAGRASARKHAPLPKGKVVGKSKTRGDTYQLAEPDEQ